MRVDSGVALIVEVNFIKCPGQRYLGAQMVNSGGQRHFLSIYYQRSLSLQNTYKISSKAFE